MWKTLSPKIVGKSLKKTPNNLDEWIGCQEIFSLSRAVEVSIQYLLLRTWAVYFCRKTSLAALHSRVHKESRQSFGGWWVLDSFGLSQQAWVLPRSLSSAVATRYLLCDWSTLGDPREQENETKKWLATSFTTLMHVPKEKNADWLLRLLKLKRRCSIEGVADRWRKWRMGERESL